MSILGTPYLTSNFNSIIVNKGLVFFTIDKLSPNPYIYASQKYTKGNEMEWIQVLSLFLANAALIVWFRNESREDWRHMDSKLDCIAKTMNENVKAIHEEMKDFHGRLERQDAEFKAHMMYFHDKSQKI